MKNLNFLSNQSDFGLENGSGLTREWLGIDSTISRKLFTLLFVLLLGFGQIWGASTTITYTFDGDATPSTSGTAPTGSTASLSGSYSNNGGWMQCANSGSAVLTLTGYEGYKITGITIQVKSNKSSGTGSFSVVAGTTTIASIASNAFSNAAWNGAWNNSSNGVTKTLTMSNSNYGIKKNENVVLSLNVTSSGKSLYIKSWAITYESAGSVCDKSVSLAQSVSNGTATFNPAGPVATCSATASDRQVSVSITPTTGYALTSGPTVSGVTNATISGSGPYTIQLPQNGNGELTLSATCTAIAVTGVSLNKNSTSIVEGSTETLTATIIPSNALDKAVTWSSDATGVATVSNAGVVTAVAPGNATITVTTHDGSFSASCTVTVTALPKDYFIDEVQGTVVADKSSAYNFSTVTIADKSTKTSGSCEEQHYHFVGWITKAKYDEGTAISDGDIQSGNKTPNNSTYYAVWAKGAGGNYTESVSWNSRYNTTTEVEGTELTIEENVTVTHNKGTNSTTCKFYTTGPGIRVYGGGNFVVTAPSALSSITLTFGSGDGSNTISANVGTYSNGAWTGNATSVTFSVGGTTGHRRIAGISATYGSVSYSDYIAKCCTPLVSINGSFNRYHLKIFHHIIMSKVLSRFARTIITLLAFKCREMALYLTLV